jgi:PAS domain S-box-containing protein
MNESLLENSSLRERKIAALIDTIILAERELEELTGDQLGRFEGLGDRALIIEAHEKARLAEANELYAARNRSAILDALPAQIALLNADGEIVAVNLAWRRFAAVNELQASGFAVGYNYIETCERAYGDNAEQAPTVAEGIRSVLSGESGGFSLEYPCHAPNTPGWYRVIAAPLFDQTLDGSVLDGAVVMHLDVTKRRQVEEELIAKQNEQRQIALMLERQNSLLRESQAVASIGSWETDLLNFKMVWSEETYRIFEVCMHEFSPSHEKFIEFVHPDDRAAVVKTFSESISSDKYAKNHSFSIDHRVLMPDGRIRFVAEGWRIRRDEQGRAIRATGTCQDITGRKVAEEERDRLFKYSLDMLCVADFEGRFEQVNPAWTECLGWTEAELIGKPMLDFILLDDHAVTIRRTQNLYSGKEIRGLKNRYVCKHGGYRWLSWNIHPLTEHRRVFAVARDVTDQVDSERHALRAQRMESIGTLAGGIAHDLNNTLSPIIMGLDMLRLKITDTTSQNLLDVLTSSARRGAEMVQQVLSFARGLEGCRVELQVLHVLGEVEKIISDTFPKDIEVRSVIDRNLWTIEGDPTQLHQVLLNLCLNARDAMPGGGVLTISAESRTIDESYAAIYPDASAGQYICIRVEDTGIGMTPEILEKAFDPFFTTKSLGKGTGLGLSTALGIVKSHGGFIETHSEPMKGTKIGVYFPAHRRPVEQSPADSSPQIPRGAGELVLVADDDAAVRSVTRHTLETYGYAVMVAVDGAEAIATFATHGPQIALVITDMMMPVMDGAATIRVLKKLDADVRIIAVSGFSSDEQVGDFSRFGVKHFLTKPFSAETLLKMVKQSLEN